jgi:hypothetical protein
VRRGNPVKMTTAAFAIATTTRAIRRRDYDDEYDDGWNDVDNDDRDHDDHDDDDDSDDECCLDSPFE